MLSHFGVMFAKALGADKVVGISRKGDKKSDVLKMGADEYIATDEDENWASKNSRSLDLIVCTVSSPKMPLMDYLQLLRVKGTFIMVGAPEDKLPDMNAFAFIAKGVKFGGSMVGPPWQIEEVSLDSFAMFFALVKFRWVISLWRCEIFCTFRC